MPEGVAAYPRWKGALSARPAFPVIAAEELRRAVNNQWARSALILVFGYAVVYVGSIHTLAQSRGVANAHTMDNFLFFLNLLRWGALAIAAIMAGPTLLEDRRQGGLELYLSRAVTRADYLAGKTLAVLGLATFAMVGPALVYVLASHLLFAQHPAQWALTPAGVLLYGLLWGLLVAGLGLGLSCIARSSRGATLLLLGGFAVTDVFISSLLEGVTRDATAKILSPFAALQQQQAWLFGVAEPFPFPAWWGLALWASLTAVGWGLVAWKHPRVAGA